MLFSIYFYVCKNNSTIFWIISTCSSTSSPSCNTFTVAFSLVFVWVDTSYNSVLSGILFGMVSGFWHVFWHNQDMGPDLFCYIALTHHTLTDFLTCLLAFPQNIDLARSSDTYTGMQCDFVPTYTVTCWSQHFSGVTVVNRLLSHRCIVFQHLHLACFLPCVFDK